MAQFDVESFMNHFLKVFQDNLTSKISEINTEKADDIVLKDIPAKQYIMDANAQTINFDELIYYGFPSITATDSHAGGISEEITMSFEVVFPSPEGGQIDNKKIMRYTRALKEIAFENARKEARISDLTIDTFSPVVIESNLISPLIRIGGITLTGIITS